MFARDAREAEWIPFDLEKFARANGCIVSDKPHFRRPQPLFAAARAPADVTNDLLREILAELRRLREEVDKK